MKFGIFAPLANPFATNDYLRALGAGVEERGFDSIWVAEHVVLFDEYASRYPYANDGRIPVRPESGILDPFAALSYLAAITTKVRLGTGICLVPQRNPVYTAKEVATLDWLSGGRFDLGIGVGWLAEEFAALGVPFEGRGSRCRAYIDVMKTLWRDPVSQYNDEFYKLAPPVSKAGTTAASAHSLRRRERRRPEARRRSGSGVVRLWPGAGAGKGEDRQAGTHAAAAGPTARRNHR